MKKLQKTQKSTLKKILRGDEGMWPYHSVPTERIKKLHKVDLDEAWLTHAKRASVRMNNGGSASFVSKRGLLATNHHVAFEALYSLSSEKRDLIKSGFLAQTEKEELRAPQLEVNVLWETTDITEEITERTAAAKTPSERIELRRGVIAEIEKREKEKSGMRSDVVPLYRGGKYFLYQYKRYTDVRIVFAPEDSIAGYGGDISNYEYPRFWLDTAFLRVYENGKPLETPYHFFWSTESPKMGETLFVSGHPGSTNRLSTYAQVVHMRDVSLPHLMDYIRRMEVSMQQYSGLSPENERRAKDELGAYQNIRKRFEGQLSAIQSPAFMSELNSVEEALKSDIRKHPSLKKYSLPAFSMLEEATAYLASVRDEYSLIEGGRGLRSAYFSIARTIVRLAAEVKKPNQKRLEEYGDARRESLLEGLYDPAPIYNDLEAHTFKESLRVLVETVGYNDKTVAALLKGTTIEELAERSVAGTSLGKVSVRKELAKKASKELSHSKDPFIQLALLIDKRARAVRSKVEEHVDAVVEEAYKRISHARFELYGESIYPDATFTLRLAYGKTVAYSKKAPEQKYTTIGGIFAHGKKHNNEGAWKLPNSWSKKEHTLKKSKAAFNFITTHDTHGGNSGSPLFTKNLEIVGLLFDGLTHTQGDTYRYMHEYPDHTVSVHTEGIYEVLDSVYGAKNLRRELKSGK